MSDVRGSMWVDPEGVRQLGNRYAEHANVYAGHLRRLQMLRTQYRDAWGDDDMGRQFSEKFLAGLDNLESMVGGVKGTLDYTASGLRSGGTAYGEVDDDARQAGHRMAHDFGSLLTTGGGGGGTDGGTGGGSSAMRPGVLREATPGAMSGRLAGTPAEPFSPATRAVAAGTPAEPFSATTRAAAGTPAEPFSPVTRAVSAPVPSEPATAATRGAFVGTPLASEKMPVGGGQTVLVGGRPLADGFRLEVVHPLPDGTTRVDANLYDAVAPVGFTSVTSADGSPLDGGHGHLFVVKDNPNANPSADGYRPMYMSFSAAASTPHS